MALRRGLPQLHAAAPLEVVDLGDPVLFAFVRRHPDGPLLAVVNLTDRDTARIDGSVLGLAGLDVAGDALAPGRRPLAARKPIRMGAYSARWLVAR